MASFQWRNLTFVVRNMSRTAGLECLREFDVIAPLFKDDNVGLLREGDWLVVKHAPVTIRVGNEALSVGQRLLSYDEYDEGDTVKLVLPITHEAFDELPLELTEAWITAAHMSNPWYIEAIKKAFGLTTVKNSEPKSGNAPSTEQQQRFPTI